MYFDEEKKTGRGFGYVAFTDSNGAMCSLQQSSAIDNIENNLPHPGTSYLWLGVNDAEPRIMKSQADALGVEIPPGEVSGWVPYPLPKEVHLLTRMHLSRKHVAGLITLLQRWLDTGQLSEHGPQEDI